MKLLQLLILSAFTLSASFSMAGNLPKDIEPNQDWTTYLIQDGVKIEYRFKPCESGQVKNQVLVLFRYTNQSNQAVDVSWKTKIYRNGECSNCHRMDNPEYGFEMTLQPGEVIAGDGSSLTNKSVYIFSHFIKKSPGMSDTRLTDFEFVDLNITSAQ